MSEGNRALGRALLRVSTGMLAVTALFCAALSWIAVSRPFDPAQLTAYTAASPTRLPDVPRYPDAITILTYHAVSDTDHAGTTVTRQRFAEHLAALAALGYRTVRLSDVESIVDHRPVALPPRPLLLTFDGGSLTDWTTIDPVLKVYHFTAVAFLNTAKIVAAGTPSFFLSRRQVDSMRQTGRWEFGSHSANLERMVPVAGDIQPAMTHRILVGGHTESDEQWYGRIVADLSASQQFLAEVTGQPGIAFAYPFGDAGADTDVARLGDRLPVLLTRAGFRFAFVGENVPTGHVDAVSDSSPRWLLPRIGVRATTSVDDLLTMIRTSTPTVPPGNLLSLPWSGDLAGCTVAGPVLRVSANGAAYGNCRLDEVNTSQWLNYSVSTRITGIDRRSTAVISVRDGTGAGHHGRIEVVIGASALIVRQQIGDDPRTQLANAPLPKHEALTVSVAVQGSQVTVTVDGRQPVTAAADPRLHEGGVMFSQASEDTHTMTYEAPTLTVLPV